MPDADRRPNAAPAAPDGAATRLFEILVREHADMLRAFLLSSVRDPVVADDLVQETFLVAWKNLDRYDRSLPFGPWARGIAAKLVLNHRRKVGRQKLYFCDEEVLLGLDKGFREIERLPGDTFDERLDAMRACLRELNDKQRTILDLHYRHGLQCKEIGRRLQAGFEAIKKHLQRGRAALLVCIQGKIGESNFAGGEAPPRAAWEARS
jgi:RNA polymerase sigma-70 factor